MKLTENTSLELLYKVEERCLQVGMSKELFMREASFAVQAFRKNSYLDGATTESKLRAVYNIALTGLTLNPVAKEAYLVPRFTNGAVEACLEPSYIGLTKLVTDTGSVNSLQTNIVFMGDLFDVDMGSNTITHKPYFTQGKEKGDIFGVYTIAHLSTGDKQFEFMSADEIREIMERSEGYKSYKAGKAKSCIWVTDFGEMARKTVIRRIVKYLPRTDRFEKLNHAVALDEEDFKITDGQYNYIHSLIRSSSLDEDARVSIEREVDGSITPSRASEIIEYLKDNQLDPIRDTGRATQTEIKERIKSISSD